MIGVSRPRWTVRVAVALATLSLVATGAAAVAQSPAATITVDGAWVRGAMMPGMPSAAYMTITNSGATDDALVGATSPIIGAIELHESKDDGTGAMSMSPVDAIPVPAGGTVAIEPGGYHLMLFDPTEDLMAGVAVPLELTFQSGASVSVSAVVGEGPAPAATITVDGAWARTSPMMEMAGAAYLVIHNSGAADDALIGVTSPAAGTVETHETKDDGTGQMAMMPVESIPVPAMGSVELKPGSFHIMLIDLVAPLAAGDVVPLTLTFQSGAVVQVDAVVGDGPAMPMGSPAASAMPM